MVLSKKKIQKMVENAQNLSKISKPSKLLEQLKRWEMYVSYDWCRDYDNHKVRS